MNDTLKQIHDLLVAQVDALSSAIDGTDDTNTAKQLLLEMDEVTHRINIIQSLLFREESSELDGYLDQIKKANQSLTKAVNSVKSVADVMQKTTTFLTYVDQAIDLAKTLAVI
jgi:archaellum component FlaC